MSEASKKLLRRQVEDIFSATHPGAREELIAPEYVENGVATFRRSSPSRVPGPATMRETAQLNIGQFPDVTMTRPRHPRRG